MAFELTTTVWQFNEAVSLLREARQYVPADSSLAEEIDEGLPDITDALKDAAAQANTGQE